MILLGTFFRTDSRLGKNAVGNKSSSPLRYMISFLPSRFVSFAIFILFRINCLESDVNIIFFDNLILTIELAYFLFLKHTASPKSHDLSQDKGMDINICIELSVCHCNMHMLNLVLDLDCSFYNFNFWCFDHSQFLA